MDKFVRLVVEKKGSHVSSVQVYEDEVEKGKPCTKGQCFHLTLDGHAKRWYSKLTIGSIRSWLDLNKAFSGAFVGNVMEQALATRLNNVRREEGESFKSYFT